MVDASRAWPYKSRLGLVNVAAGCCSNRGATIGEPSMGSPKFPEIPLLYRYVL